METRKKSTKMKKIFYTLFFVFVFIPVLMAANWDTTTSLNPYAYGLTSSWDAITQQLTISFTLNAPAVIDETYNDAIGIQIYAVDKETEQEYYMYAVPTNDCKTAGTKTYVIDLSDGKGNTDVELPKNTELTWEVVVHGDNKTLTAPKQLLITKDGVKTGQIRKWRFPTSVAVNNDPNSTDFGSIYVAGNAYYQGTEAREYRGVQKVNPQFENMGWYGIYTGNTNSPLRVRISDDGRVFASSTTTSAATVWEVSNDLNNWTTRISESSQNHGMDVKGSGNDLKLLLYSYKNSKYICNEYTWNSSSFSAATPVSVMHNSTAFGISGASTPHVNIRYDNYYDGYWFIGSRSNDTERQLAHIVEDGTSCDVAYTGNDHFGGAGALSYDEMLVKGHDNGHTTNNPSKLIFYRVSKNANGKVKLTVAYDEAKLVHSTCKGRYVNDFAIDHAYNLYIVSTQNSSVAAGNKSILAETGQLMAFALPYSGHTTTRARDIADYTFSLVCDETIDYQVTLVANDNVMGSASITQGTKLNDGYQSCTDVTVTATANDGYRFVNWTVGGNVVSEANPYEFIVTKDVEVQANFAPAVFYGIVWKNLFQKEEDDITKESLDGTLNNRLWRLYQVQFNKYAGNRSDKGLNTYGEFDVAGFIGTEARGNSNIIYLTAEETNETYPFAWLGKYIEDVSGTKILNITNESNRRSHLNYIMYLFFNRTTIARNSSAQDATYLVQWTDNTKSFQGADGYGMPIKWRPYWTEYACKLPNTLEYDDPMPTTWTKLSCSTDPVKNDAGTIIGTPADWYQWNNPPSERHLLAWRDGSTSGDIVHHVDRDNMVLYATYVNRHISEVKDNTDVIRLMQNSGYKDNPHALTVDRKLQAGMYNTICFPFTVYINDEGGKSGLAADHPLKGATVLNLIGKNELYDESGDPVVVLNFEQVNKLEAGKPYLIKLAENQPSITEPIHFMGVEYDDLTYINGNHTITTDDGAISFHAMISPGDIPAESVILVADNRLAVTTASGQMDGLRGYFTINDAYLQSVAKAGRLYLSVKKPTTTSIPIAPEAEQPAQPKVRKVMHDGKIYILRGDEVYTITGARVK